MSALDRFYCISKEFWKVLKVFYAVHLCVVRKLVMTYDSVSLDEIDYVNIILLLQFVKNSILFSLVTLQIAK